MKEIGLDTVGGRIRKVRQDVQMSMQTFAENLGITGNYVGLLERGKRNPSAELLLKISSTMNVPYEWLVSGGQRQYQESPLVGYFADERSDPAKLVNPQLYLSIAIAMAPSITKEALVPMLGVSSQTIDEILAGKTVEYNPRWRVAYSLIAENLDLPVLRRDLLRLNTYLAGAEVTIKNGKLLHTLKKYLAKSYELVEVYSINGQSPNVVPDYTPYTDIVFRCGKGSPAFTLLWHFLCPLEKDKLEDFLPEDEYSKAHILAEQDFCAVSIVLTSSDEFHKMYDFYSACQSNNEALAELDCLAHSGPDISAIHFDSEKEVLDDWIGFEDDSIVDELLQKTRPPEPNRAREE